MCGKQFQKYVNGQINRKCDTIAKIVSVWEKILPAGGQGKVGRTKDREKEYE